MPPKTKTVWFCSACGNESPKWMGRCPVCGEWTTMVEEKIEVRSNAKRSDARSAGQCSRPLTLP